MEAAFEAMRMAPTSPQADDRRPSASPARRRAAAPGLVRLPRRTCCDGPRSQPRLPGTRVCLAVVFLSGHPGDVTARRATSPAASRLSTSCMTTGVKLVASRQTRRRPRCTAGPNAQEFPRTVSRLAEMRTSNTSLLHASDGASGRPGSRLTTNATPTPRRMPCPTSSRAYRTFEERTGRRGQLCRHDDRRARPRRRDYPDPQLLDDQLQRTRCRTTAVARSCGIDRRRHRHGRHRRASATRGSRRATR